jgi:phage terminase large subunit-like protein
MAEIDEAELRELLGEDPVSTIRELREEEAYRLLHEKFRFYEPNGKCEEFIREVGEDKRLVVFFSAANGVGKTCVAANVVANIMFGQDNLENKWFDYPLYREWPYPKRGRVVSQASNIVKNLIPTLEEWLPLGRYKATKGGKQFNSQWEMDNGWTFDIMTNEQDPKEFEGPTLGWIWCDEPPTEPIYKACISRLRAGGVLFITATPLNGSAWMFDEIVAKKDKAAEVEK